VRARVVINATGAWADGLRQQLGAPSRIRPLRGSHLIFPAWKLPVAQAISFLHPQDRRPVFIFPWEGITLVGTTDVDHAAPLDGEPRIGAAEVSYLMEAVRVQFPSLDLNPQDVMSTFAGVRPVVGTGKADPSKESRDHVLWDEQGLLTVTGGKLTTFRLIALHTLALARERLPEIPKIDRRQPVLDPVDEALLADSPLEGRVRRRLLGRYGADAPSLLSAAVDGELRPIADTDSIWAEVRWAARAEGVVHLDDLLLRRVRLGLLTEEGAWPIMERIRVIAQPELVWDDARWEWEADRYAQLWRECYSLPDPASMAESRQPVDVQVGAARQRPAYHPSAGRRAAAAKSQISLKRVIGCFVIAVLTLGLALRRYRSATGA
jgi:glycerol-3-phosphate dehydrogenase